MVNCEEDLRRGIGAVPVVHLREVAGHDGALAEGLHVQPPPGALQVAEVVVVLHACCGPDGCLLHPTRRRCPSRCRTALDSPPSGPHAQRRPTAALQEPDTSHRRLAAAP